MFGHGTLIHAAAQQRQFRQVAGVRPGRHPDPAAGRGAGAGARVERVHVDRVAEGALRPHGALHGQQLEAGEGALAGEGVGAGSQQLVTRVKAAEVPTRWQRAEFTEVVQFYTVITICRFYTSTMEVGMQN